MALATAATTLRSKGSGRMRSAVGHGTQEARRSAAAISMSSVTRRMRLSSAPRKMPGKARTLLIWFENPDRPVATIDAPAARASSGMISGTGLAKAKTIGFGSQGMTHGTGKNAGLADAEEG